MSDFKHLLKDHDIELSAEKLAQLDTLVAELLLWNEKTNLTAIREAKDVWIKHILDSLTILPVLPESAFTMIDIGSGAGFPGLPLKIARPDADIIFLEAVRKKTDFIDHIIEKLGLTEAQTANRRAEDLGRDKDYREQFDVATARAVAYLPTLVEYALPFLKEGGIFIAQKGFNENFAEELAAADLALKTLGGKVREVREIELPGVDRRALVIIEKFLPTPAEYPRPDGIPKQKPL